MKKLASLTCVRCQYPLEGLPKRKGCLTCPECGFSGSPADLWRASMRRRGAWRSVWRGLQGWPLRFWVGAPSALIGSALIGGASGSDLLRIQSIAKWWTKHLGVWRLDSEDRMKFILLCSALAFGLTFIGVGVWAVVIWIRRRPADQPLQSHP